MTLDSTRPWLKRLAGFGGPLRSPQGQKLHAVSFTAVLSVFGVTERPVRPRMPRPIYLYHPVRMTDGGFRDTYTIRMGVFFVRMGVFFVFSGTKPIRNG